MKNNYIIAILFALLGSIFITNGQNLNWTPPGVTMGNHTIAFSQGSILFNGSELNDPEAILGAFYINSSGNYSCGGCMDFNNDGNCDSLAEGEIEGGSLSYINGGSIAITAWGADGIDTGFGPNELIQFFLQIDGVNYPSSDITFSMSPLNYEANGLTFISSINFQATQLEPCTCSNPEINVYEDVNGFCIIQATNYCASDPTQDNYCNVTGYTTIIVNNDFNPAEVCEDTLGCTCEQADNYDSSATEDDGSCIITGGCSDSLASNYSGLECDNSNFIDENCDYPGCTCSIAANWDSVATIDDGTCVVVGGCNDSSASNYSGNECSNSQFITEACEYASNDSCEDDDTAFPFPCATAILAFTCDGEFNGISVSDACPESCDNCGTICEDDDTAFPFTCATAITAFTCDGEFNGISVSDACPESCDNCNNNDDTSCELENIDWDFDITDGNMTVLVSQDAVLINGEEPPCGSLIGGFYTNDNGELACGGYQVWCDDFSNNQLAIPLWKKEGELDGFESAEEITWLLKVGVQTFTAENSSMNPNDPFNTTVFIQNGFAQLLSSEYNCEISGVAGCLDESAYNYNSDATYDDGSCYNLDWTVTLSDCNMTILINEPEISNLNISLNGAGIPTGATIGIFYENENGQLVCGGSEVWSGTSTAVPAWGSESGLDNGFQVGEGLTNWALLIGNQTIPMDENGAVMGTQFGPNSDTYNCQGFGNLTSVNFVGEYTLTYGCTDETACNYDALAMLEDNSCEYTQTWYSDSDGDGLGNPAMSAESCDEVPDFVTNNDDPCPDNLDNPNNTLMWYYDTDGDGLGDEFYINGTPGCNSPGPEYVDNNNDLCPLSALNDANNNGICDADEIEGCTNENALNYIPDANVDDDSCIDIVPGCTDEAAFNFNPDANTDDDSCIAVIEGCTDETAFNFNSDANTDDSSCIAVVEGCTDENAFNFNADANTDDNSCIAVVEGCTDENAFNFNTDANTDDSSCIAVVEGCTDENAFNFNPDANTDDDSCIEIIEGCTDENAFNFNPDANTDDNSCIEIIEGCTDENAFNFNPDANTDDDSCVAVVEGCTDENAFNFDPDANTNDNTCIAVVEGCTNETSFNYNATANTDDGSCIAIVNGCTDETACNFIENANTDDNSCYYVDGICESCEDGLIIDNDSDNDGLCDANEVVGCQDQTACNYDPNATNPCAEGSSDNINSINFGGENNDSYLKVENSNIDFSNNFTISFQVNTEIGQYELSDNDYNPVFYMGEINQDGSIASSDTDQLLEIYFGNSEMTMNVVTESGTTGDYFGGSNFTNAWNNDSNWMSISVVCDEGTYKMYFNGLPSVESYNWGSIVDDNHPFYIGKGVLDELANGGQSTFDGLIDNFQIWEVALNQQQISNYLDCPPSGVEIGLAAFWDFNNSEDLGYDLTNNVNTIINEVSVSNNVPIQDCTYSCCTYVPEGEPCAGCTDEAAFNYNPEAVDDDGSCIAFVYGCTDDTACNFSADANTDDDSCISVTTWYLDEDGDGLGFDSGGFFEIVSCTEPNDDTLNYVDNGDDPSEGDYDNDLVFTNDDCDDTDENIGAAESGYNCNGECLLDEDGDGICNEFEISGCTDDTACNFNTTATDDDESCAYAEEFYDCEGICLSDIDVDGVCDELEIFGCTDDSACNFNTTATENDNSCFYTDGICQTCENSQIIDNDEDGDGICNDDEILGCTDDTACNFNLTATEDNNSCFYTDGICQTCENAQIIDNDIDDDAVCDADEIPGCDDISACNFDILATDNDGSCIYIDGVCETCELGQIIDNDIDNDGVCNDDEIPGCTDPNACNYNSLATDENNSCLYLDGICETCEVGQIIDNDIDNDGICNDDEIPGCTDLNACNYDPDLGCTDDDGSCFYSEITANVVIIDASCEAACDGEIQLTIDNGQPPYLVEYNSGEFSYSTGGNLVNACVGTYIIEITDSYNCEYQLIASVSFDPDNPDTDGDGICDDDEILGCTDINACNYDSDATEENASCYYCTGLGDLDGNGFDDCELLNYQAIMINNNPPIFDCNGCINDTDFDGVCDELEIIGCTDDGQQLWSVTPGYAACTYNSSATEPCEDIDDNGIQDCCEYPSEFYLTCDGECADTDTNNNFIIDLGENGNGDIDNDGVCNILEIEGCQESDACNYDASATDSGICIFPEEFYNCDGCIVDTDGDGVCDELEVEGCQDGLACNFIPEATDPSACYYLELSTFVDENILNVTCPGASDGSFTIYTTGGNGPYSIYIENFNGNEYTSESVDGVFIVSGASGGSYDVYISDVNGCETLESVDVEEENAFEIQINYLNFISCDGENDGALTSAISGGTPPYTFSWLNPQGNIISIDQDAYNLSTGAYAVQVTDAEGCLNQTTFVLGEPNVLGIEELIINDVSCYNGNDGNVDVLINGGTPPFTYSFNSLNGSTVNPNSLSSGEFIISITDDNGCELTDVFTIDEPNPQNINLSSLNTEICEGEITTINSSGSFTNYIWTEAINGVIFGNNTSSLNVNTTGIYSVTAISSEGCEVNSPPIEITVYDNPVFNINGLTDVITGNTQTYYTQNNSNTSQWSIEPEEMGDIIGSDNVSDVQIIWNLQGQAELLLTQTNDNGCTTTETISIDITLSVGLDDIENELDFVVFPNPFSDYTNIHVNNLYDDEYNVFLYDSKGKLVISLINQTEQKIKLKNNFSSGLYNMKITCNNLTTQKVIIVQ